MKAYQNEALENLRFFERKLLAYQKRDMTNEINTLRYMVEVLEQKGMKNAQRLLDNTGTISAIIDLLPQKDIDKVRLFFDVIKDNLKILNYRRSAILIPDALSSGFNKNKNKIPLIREYLQEENLASFNGRMRLIFEDASDKDLERLYQLNHDLVHYMEIYTSLKINYYDVKGFPNEEQYREIEETLDSLVILEKFKQTIKIVLKKIAMEVTIRQSQNMSCDQNTANIEELKKAKTARPFKTETKKEEKKPLSKKEWYALNIEANRYYNLTTNCEIRDLIPLEKIEFLKILKKLDYSDDEIDTMLTKINTKCAGSILSLALTPPFRSAFILTEIYKKLCYLNMTDYKEYIDEIILEIKNSKTFKERMMWKNELLNTFKEAYQQMPRLDDYEKLRAEGKLSRQNK